jgi:chaperonin GroEL
VKKFKAPVKVVMGSSLRRGMLNGVMEITRAVAATYGPRGRTVMLDRPGGLLSTKDGATVAWEIDPEDQVCRLGTRVVQDACARVDRACGDGTTTTAILIRAIMEESARWVAAGAHPVLLAEDLRVLADDLVSRDLFNVVSPEPLRDENQMREVALAACDGDVSLADGVVDALSRVGSEGMVVVEEGKGRGVEVEHRRGTELDRGWESGEFAGPDGVSRHLDTPLVALVDGMLDSLEDVRVVLEEATQFPHPLLVVSCGCFGPALQTIVTNDRKLTRSDGGTFEVVAVRIPGHGGDARDLLDDVAALTGASVVDPKVTSLREFRSEQLGSVQTATVRAESTTLVAFEDRFPLVEARVEQLRHAEVEATHTHDAEEIRTRIAKITDGLCVMRVGGSTNAEIREKRGRVEDALSAVRLAVERGVVPGAGIAYLALGHFLAGSLRISRTKVEHGRPDLSVTGLGAKILARALREPLRTLALNAGCEPSVVERRVLEASEASGVPSWDAGWDAMTNEVRDLRLAPALRDPRGVMECAVLTAISAASTLLTAEVALIRKDRYDNSRTA